MSRRGYGAYGRRKGYRYADYHIPPLLDLAHGGTFTRGSEASYWSASGVMSWAPSNERRITNALWNGATTYGVGVQLEGSSTNYARQSEDFTTTWAQVGTPGISVDLTAPDSEADATTLTDNDAGGYESLQQNSITQGGASTNHCFSIFIKKDSDESRFPEIQLPHTSAARNIQINTKTGATGVRTDSAATIVDHGTVDHGDWWRMWVVFTTIVGETTTDIRIFPSIGGTWLTAVSTGTGSIGAWGVQLETGSFPTSYIRTTTGSVTRSADSLTYTSVPAALRDQRQLWTVWPSFATGEGVGERIFDYVTGVFDDVATVSAGNRWVVQDAGSNIVDTGTVTSHSRQSKLGFLLDPGAGTMDLSGFDAGDGQYTGTAWTWATGNLVVGSRESQTLHLNGIFANVVRA